MMAFYKHPPDERATQEKLSWPTAATELAEFLAYWLALGGWLFSFFGADGVTGFNIYSMFVAVLGTVVVLWVYYAIYRRIA